MGKHVQLVMGPAGSGKSTYCDVIRTHCETKKRVVHCINLDPGTPFLTVQTLISSKQQQKTFDILFQLTSGTFFKKLKLIALYNREMITVDDVMEDLSFGPNGGLIYAMEFFMQVDSLLDFLH